MGQEGQEVPEREMRDQHRDRHAARPAPAEAQHHPDRQARRRPVQRDLAGRVDECVGEHDAGQVQADQDHESQHGQRLRFVARLRDDGRASVGLEALAIDDPLAQGQGCDNRVAVWSCRYRAQPLLIQGPGAGAEVTAAALLDDVLRLARG